MVERPQEQTSAASTGHRPHNGNRACKAALGLI
jgi:hypothetical protein